MVPVQEATMRKQIQLEVIILVNNVMMIVIHVPDLETVNANHVKQLML